MSTPPNVDETQDYRNSPAPLSPGAVVGGYRIEALLGIGGMGAVYRATDMALGRVVAFKVVRSTNTVQVSSLKPATNLRDETGG